MEKFRLFGIYQGDDVNIFLRIRARSPDYIVKLSDMVRVFPNFTRKPERAWEPG